MKVSRIRTAVAATLATYAALTVAAEAATFTNATPIAIPDSGAASPYPSTISVPIAGQVSLARATLHSISHTNPDDIDVLLVAPNGAKTLLMSDTCGGVPISDLTFTFDDAAPAQLPDSQPCAPSGSYRPTDFTSADGDDPFPGPAASPPYPAALSALSGGPAVGDWKLFVNDDAPIDTGTIAGGWTLELQTDVSGITCAGKGARVATHVGTSGPDRLIGTPGPDILIGLGGNDTISGLGGKDVICGGAGNDKLFGGPGKDLLRGEGGKDKLKGQGGKDTCIGGPKPDTAKGCEKEKSV